MIQMILDEIGKRWPIREKKTKTFRAKGIRFHVKAYEALGLGHVSVMTGSGMLGLMKMDTLIVNPFLKDAPLLSYDRIHALGNDTLFLEMFDTMLGNSFSPQDALTCAEKRADWLENPLGAHWYDSIRIAPCIHKKGKKADSPELDAFCGEVVRAYLKAADACGECDPAKKRRKALAYSEGLLKNGGPATDPVKKAIGEEAAAELFRVYLFGTD